MEAARRYDPEVRNRFLLCRLHVRESIVNALHRQAGALRLPGARSSRASTKPWKLEARAPRAPSESEIARESGSSEAQVRWLPRACAAHVSSIPMPGRKRCGPPAARGTVPAAEESAVRYLDAARPKAAVRKLSPREGWFSSAATVSMDPSRRPCGRSRKCSGISAERVRQVEGLALDKLRRPNSRGAQDGAAAGLTDPTARH